MYPGLLDKGQFITALQPEGMKAWGLPLGSFGSFLERDKVRIQQYHALEIRDSLYCL